MKILHIDWLGLTAVVETELLGTIPATDSHDAFDVYDHEEICLFEEAMKQGVNTARRLLKLRDVMLKYESLVESIDEFNDSQGS